LIKANNQAEKDRPLIGTKAIRTPVMAAMKVKGYLIMAGSGERKMRRATIAPPANSKNCFKVMSPTRRNS